MDLQFIGNLKKNNMKEYEIEFGNHLLALIEVENNEIKVIASINGWGNPIEIETIKITKKDERIQCII